MPSRGEGGVVTIVSGLQLGRWDVSAGLEEAAVVEPVHPLQAGDLDLLDGPPRTLWSDQLGLEQPDQRFGQALS